ncbi:MAG: hypothetical protein AAFN63_17610, partial [Pseudomonadota bacterium]
MLKKIIVCVALATTPQVAAAQSVQDQIVSQLRDQGFGDIRVQRTWLGRIRVISQRDGVRRELVFNPQTGEILRDYWRDADDDGPRLFNPGGGSSSSGGSGSNGGGAGSSSGSGGDDDDDDDDRGSGNARDDDDDDDDD